MKNNLSWYRHQTIADSNWKFKTLRRKYGWAGEGKFWALNNRIATAQDCKLSLSNEDQKQTVASDLDFDIEEFEEYIAFLVEKAKLLQREGDLIFTNDVQEDLKKMNLKRSKNKEWYEKNKEWYEKNKETEKRIQSTESSVKITEPHVQGSEIPHNTIHYNTGITNVIPLADTSSQPADEKQEVFKGLKKEFGATGKSTAPPPLKKRSPKKYKNAETELFQRFYDMYTAWYKTREGRMPKMSDGGNKHLKNLSVYFRSIAIEFYSGKECTDDDINKKAIDLLSKMLVFDWDKMTMIKYKQQTDIKSINSHINDILKHQKSISDGSINGHYEEGRKNTSHRPTITGRIETAGDL
jgi:hypothetical protein